MFAIGQVQLRLGRFVRNGGACHGLSKKIHNRQTRAVKAPDFRLFWNASIKILYLNTLHDFVRSFLPWINSACLNDSARGNRTIVARVRT